MLTRTRLVFIGISLFLLACGKQPSAVEGPKPRVAGLPPIPAVEGALRIDVVAPGENEELPTRDSTFIYGSVGTGRATLTIDGVPVKVEPNGSFLAWLPVPGDGTYQLQAAANGQTTTLDRHVRVPGGGAGLSRDRARILDYSVSPTGDWVVQPGERIDVSFRGTPGGRAWLVLPDGARVPLVESAAIQQAAEGVAEFSTNQNPGTRAVSGVSSYSGFFLARPIVAADSTARLPQLAQAVLPPLAVPPAPVPDTLQLERRTPAGDRVERRPSAGVSGKATRAKAGAGKSTKAKTASKTMRAQEAPAPPRPARNPNGLVGPRGAGAAVIELVVNADTARMPLPLTVAVMDRPRVGVANPPAPDETHRAEVVGRPGPSGPYTWFWPAGTRFTLTGERGNMYRVQLAGQGSAWISASEVRLLPEGTPPPFARVGTVRFRPQPGFIDARFAIAQSIPFRVDETLNSITVTLYGAQSETNFMQYGATDPLIRYAEWRQQADSVYTLTVNLTRSVWGYRTFFTPDGNLVLRIRRPPTIDPGNPVRGLKIALDPGHPPGGATGPTRLSEADANLWIALKLRDLLQRAGATVMMTRTTNVAVPLNVRPVMAADSNADILISIHNNGLPNGVNPFGNTGTSDYYFHPRAAELALDLDREIVRELGTLDLGTGRADLALARPTWMPAVLTETVYLMVPEQEAALRNPAVQDRIAQAHLRGLEEFLRKRAREQPAP